MDPVKDHTEKNSQDPTIAQQVRVLLDLYRRYGPINFDYGNVDDSVGEFRKELQNPSLFAVSSLPMQAWWTLPGDTLEMLKQHRDAIVEEYDRYHSSLEDDEINQDDHCTQSDKKREEGGYWVMKYLMREGKWCSDEIQEEKFVKTVEMLLRLPLMENRLGCVYFSELSSSNEMRAHCGPTNVKVRVLYPLLIEKAVKSGYDCDTFIMIANDRRDFIVGEPLVFDDSFYHSIHIGNGVLICLTLMIDIWHPYIRGDDVKSAITAAFLTSNDDHIVVDTVATMLNSQYIIQGQIDDSNAGIALDGSEVIGVSVGGNDDVETISTTPIAPPIATATTLLITPLATICGNISDPLKGCGELFPAKDYFLSEQSRFFPELIVEHRLLQQQSSSNTLYRSYDYLFKLLVIGDSSIGKSAFVSRAVDDTFTERYYQTNCIDFKMYKASVINPLLFPTDINTMSSISSQPIVVAVDGVEMDIPTNDIPTKKQDDYYEAPSQHEVNKRKVYKIISQVWDTVGSERFHTMASSFYRGTHGIFIMYDVCDRETFKNVPRWVEEIRNDYSISAIIILIGTKADIYEDHLMNPNDAKEKGSKHELNTTRKSFATRQVSYEEGLHFAEQYHFQAFLEVSSKDNFQIHDAFSTMLSLLLKQALLYGNIAPSPYGKNNPQSKRNSGCAMS